MSTIEQTITKQEETYKIFIGNLSFASTDESLKAYFGDAGEVVETIIIKTGPKPKGYGFVAFKTLNQAEKAVKDFDKKDLDGREISVQIANPRKEPIKKPAGGEKKKKRSNKKPRSNKPTTTTTNSEEEEQNNNITTTTSTTNQQQQEEKHELPSTATTAQEPKPKTSVFVANLPLHVRKYQLAKLFKDYQVESALVAINTSGYSKRYGFVELKTVEEMQRVLKECVNIEIRGHPIHISAATSEKNTAERVKPTRKNNDDETVVVDSSNIDGGGNKKRGLNGRRHKKSVAARASKEKEGEAVGELKEESNVAVSKGAQDVVIELGVSAAKAADKAVDA